MRFGLQAVKPYSKGFDEAPREEVEPMNEEERDENLVDWVKRPDAILPCLTFKHLLPIRVGVKATESNKGKRIWNLKEGAL